MYSAYSLLVVNRTSESIQLIPCGLMLLIRGLRHLPNQRLRSVYVWYLSDAPRKVLSGLGLAPSLVPKPIASTLLDIALCESFEMHWSGRIGLHADPDGGDELITYYRDRRRMLPLPEKKKLPVDIRKKEDCDNDGRFFYYDTDAAIAQSQQFDPYRER